MEVLIDQIRPFLLDYIFRIHGPIKNFLMKVHMVKFNKRGPEGYTKVLQNITQNSMKKVSL